jgi:hypothetical protein
MPTSDFVIETYKVRVTQNLSANNRFIDLVSVDLSHGIRYNAQIMFMDSNPFESRGNIGRATNLGGENFDPIILGIWFHESYFDGFYQVLSSEKPVSFRFIYQASPSTTKNITSATLLTGFESPGDFETFAAIFPLEREPAT